MLKRVRARTLPVAAALLVSLLALSLPHIADADHDPDGAVVVFAHNASTHALGAPAPDDGAPVHCVVCHFARSLRLRTEVPSLPAPATSSGALVHVEVSTATRPAPVAQPPLRSPPATPVSVLASVLT